LTNSPLAVAPDSRTVQSAAPIEDRKDKRVSARKRADITTSAPAQAPTPRTPRETAAQPTTPLPPTVPPPPLPVTNISTPLPPTSQPRKLLIARQGATYTLTFWSCLFADGSVITIITTLILT